MSVLKVALNQIVAIPELPFDDGTAFTGRVESNNGDRLVIEHDSERKAKLDGRSPERVFTMLWGTGENSRSCPVVLIGRSKGKLVCKVAIEERRESLRVRCAVEMHFTPIAPADLNRVAEEVLARVDPIEDPDSEVKSLLRLKGRSDESQSELAAIRRLLERLVQQVDYLTRVAEGHRAVAIGGETRALEVLDCSSSGLAIRHGEALQAGSYLKIRLVFDSAPRIEVRCVGAVVRCQSTACADPNGRSYEIGIRFTHIHESNRERIVRHIFRVQRDQLRDRRAA